MIISRNTRDRMRKEIKELLREVPEGEKVKLEKSKLEMLLFEKIRIPFNGQEVDVLLPVWSGIFLERLDLSEVDFSNVSWSLLNPIPKEAIHEGKQLKNFQREIQKCDQIAREVKRNNNSLINYANTNANINLGKSFEAKNGKCIILSKCDFSNLNLQRPNDLNQRELYLYRSNIGNTDFDVSSARLKVAVDSDLTNIDLTSELILAEDYFKGDSLHFGNCNLRGTGCNIKLPNALSDYLKNRIRLAMSGSGKWTGCVINGKSVHSYEERQEAIKLAKKAYDDLTRDYFDSIKDAIKDAKQKAKS